MEEILCRCGHGMADHPDVGRANYIVCNGCFVENRPMGIFQVKNKDCGEYIPDNLTHIEQLALQKGLIQ